MRTTRKLGLFAVLTAAVMSVGGVFAAWSFADGTPVPAENSLGAGINQFKYGVLYINGIEIKGGSYARASFNDSADTKMSADLQLNADGNSTVLVEVSFYNHTSVTYYYNKTERKSTNNEGIAYTVSGIESRQEIPAQSKCTLTVEFSYADGANLSNGGLLSELEFLFVIDKDQIGGVVATTAVEKFAEILNDDAAGGAYQTLVTAMDNRGTQAYQLSYIGNVAGEDSDDSAVINALFGQGFMEMDLDGDGQTEPITIMIKRENIDGKDTGASYEHGTGVEMCLYITATDFNELSWSWGGNSIDVWAIAFTTDENGKWVELVPLTAGTATTNNYEGSIFGEKNSFDTDSWRSNPGGQEIKDLVP